MKALNKSVEMLTKVLMIIASAYLIYLLIACTAQVISRYVFNSSLSWTEETARYAFAGMGLIGIPVALSKGMHVCVDVLENKLSGIPKEIQKIIHILLEIYISVIFVVFGWKLFSSMNGIYSPAVRVPMQAVYYAIPLCGLSSLWILIVDLVNHILGLIQLIKNGDR